MGKRIREVRGGSTDEREIGGKSLVGLRK